MTDERLLRNREYWNEQARSNAMWHISHSESEEGFRGSAVKDATRLFGEALELIPRGGRVLEIGCGLGRVLEKISELVPETHFFGVDVSTEMVRGANARLRDRRNVFVLRTNGDSLDSFDDAYFDLVYSVMVFQHLPTTLFARYAQEVARVLRPRGRFRFQVQYDRATNGIDTRRPDDFRSIRYYGVDDLRRVLPASLPISEFPATPAAAKVHDYYVTADRSE
jgi:SAM-dependent methyltransferase